MSKLDDEEQSELLTVLNEIWNKIIDNKIIDRDNIINSIFTEAIKYNFDNKNISEEIFYFLIQYCNKYKCSIFGEYFLPDRCYNKYKDEFKKKSEEIGGNISKETLEKLCMQLYNMWYKIYKDIDKDEYSIISINKYLKYKKKYINLKNNNKYD